MVTRRRVFWYPCIMLAVWVVNSAAFASPVDVIYIGTWSLAPGSGNGAGVGGPGMAQGQRYVINITYDSVSTVTNGVPVLTGSFTPSGNTMSTIDLSAAGNSLDIFVPMEGFDAGSPFIYVQNETNHFFYGANTLVPTLNFIDGSDISDIDNIIGLEFEGDFVAGGGNNLIEIFNTSAGPFGAPVSLDSQILNFGTGIAIKDVNNLQQAVDVSGDAGPDIVYSAAMLSATTTSSLVQTNDLGAFRSDGEDFIDANWTESGNPLSGMAVGNDITVSFANSGLSGPSDTTNWLMQQTEQMTGLSDSDTLGVSFFDPDLGGDGVTNDLDNCPGDHNPLQEDFDGDGAG